jgi:predicted O-methyltransferase YrrM
MKIINIKQKLEEFDVPLSSIRLGDFDYIGHFTAERHRQPDDANYSKIGCFYRSNYERGILIYYLIRKFNLTSMLEIGFGRGYSTFCAAKAFTDAGIKGKIVTVDPDLNEDYLKQLQAIFPKEWFEHIEFVKARSQDYLSQLNDKFDLVYIDGDHSYEATKSDWNMTKEKFNSFILFDDYHLPSKNDPGIACAKAIDEIDESIEKCNEKELIILDRRIFFDDRQQTDDQVNYGQILLQKSSVKLSEW